MTISAAALVRTSLIFVVVKQRSNAGPQGNDRQNQSHIAL
jgi:hypothetical protein